MAGALFAVHRDCPFLSALAPFVGVRFRMARANQRRDRRVRQVPTGRQKVSEWQVHSVHMFCPQRRPEVAETTVRSNAV